MIDEKQLAEEVREILMDVLGVDAEELAPSARFFDDLGGESIDVLELSFRCEKHFGVRIQFETMLSPDEDATDGQGRLTAEFLTDLQSRFPFLDLSALGPQSNLMDLRGLFTVETIIEFLKLKLAEGEAQPAG
jgi:acyl carrier protein